MAGTIVAVSGSGFPANVNVGIYLAALDTSLATGEPVRYAAGRTDANGRATLSITMPSNWPNGAPIAQDKVVVTMARTDFSVSASAVFNYLSPGPTWTPTPIPTATTTPPATATAAPNPSANLTPRSGGAGTVVTITGSGFPGNSTIYAHLAPLGGSGGSGNEYANYAIVATNANGDYTMIFAMPAVWPNGTPIKTGRIAILIATADFSQQTSVTLRLCGCSAAGRQRPTPTNTPVPSRRRPCRRSRRHRDADGHTDGGANGGADRSADRERRRRCRPRCRPRRRRRLRRWSRWRPMAGNHSAGPIPGEPAPIEPGQ